MPQVATPAEVPPLTLLTEPAVHLSDDQLLELCRLNRELRIERNARGELEIMPPAGGRTSSRNSDLIRQLTTWADADATGVAFDSSAGFRLPDGAVRGPDVAWVRREKLAALPEVQKEKFLPLCPDFVLELRSPSDSLRRLQAKMEEYLANGARLGFLVDAEERRVHVYRPDGVQVLEAPSSVAGDPVLPGFRLELGKIWTPGW